MRLHKLISALVVLVALTILGSERLPVPFSATISAAGANDRASDDRERSIHPFVVDVALDGRTWRMNDGSNPFFPTFTGALSRGATFIVSGPIYRGFTLRKGGEFGGTGNPAGPETPGAIGMWVCRGTFNLDIAQIAAGEAPHVTSTQFFYFNNGSTIVSDGPEGGATVLRAIVGGTGRYNEAHGEMTETPLGVNTTNMFNVRFQAAVR